MKRRRVLMGVLFLLASQACAKTSGGSISASVGSNTYGGTITFSYEYPLWSRLFLGAGLGWGGASFTQKAGADFYGEPNHTGHDLNDNVTVNSTFDLYAGWVFFRGRKWEFLNRLCLGVSYFDASYEVSYDETRPGYDPGDYRGIKRIAHNAVFLQLNLVEFRPAPRGVFFCLGLQCRATFLRSPQYLDLFNEDGDEEWIDATNKNGTYVLYPFPEAMVRLGYDF